MAADKFLFLSGGARSEKAGATAATPNAIPALDSSGRVSLVQMPVGIGPEAKTMKASGSISAGDFVNIFNDGGTLKARAADASTTGKEANGFVLAAYSDGEDAIVYGLSGQLNTQVTGKTLGARQYLSAASAGKTVETAPSGDGQVVQLVGKAVAATEILPVISRIIVLAGGTPPPAPSYWNGTDDTVDELVGTQWGASAIGGAVTILGTFDTTGPDAGSIGAYAGSAWMVLVRLNTDYSTLSLVPPAPRTLYIADTIIVPQWRRYTYIDSSNTPTETTATFVGASGSWNVFSLSIPAGCRFSEFSFTSIADVAAFRVRIYNGNPL